MFAYDSIMVKCGPSWEEEEVSVAGVTLSWRSLSQQDALKWSLEKLKTHVDLHYLASILLPRPSQSSVF